MGDIAEAMLDGTMCAGCGEYLGEDAGYPIYCHPCQRMGFDPEPPVRATITFVRIDLLSRAKVKCVCGRTVSAEGFHQHWQVKHDPEAPHDPRP